VTGQISFGCDDYQAGTDFIIHNISTCGFGLVVKKTAGRRRGLLYSLRPHEKIRCHFNLMDFESRVSTHSVQLSAEVVWNDRTHFETAGYIGAKFMDIGKKAEDLLHRFVHLGQLFFIRRGGMLLSLNA
jgi:hypothetical protein